MKWSQFSVVALMGFFIQSCNTTTNSPVAEPIKAKPYLSLNAEYFKPTQVLDQNQIFELTEEQQNRFLDYYHDPENSHVSGHKRLYEYLEIIIGNFHYLGDTHTAEEAFAKKSGNCLSLAIMTASLAKLVGIETKYQKVNSAPIYHRHNNIMTVSSHVRTHVYDPDFIPKKDVIAIRPRIVVDYFPQVGDIRGERVSQDDFVSMYYQNLAGKALINNANNLAYSLLSQALEYSPFNPSTLNSLAVLYNQIGVPQQSEDIYRYAIKHTSGSVNILSNYAVLLEKQGRVDEAKSLGNKISDTLDDNPYRWLNTADDYYAKSRFVSALKFYKRSVETGPYLHEGYLGLAKTYHQMGRIQSAKESMRKALAWAYIPDTKKLYQAKLVTLEQQAH